jgi:beta-glucosidase
MTARIQFPADFIWGSATSAYQIEGSPLADGAGASIWQRFSRTKGMISNGDTGDIACDHYNRFASDIALMKQMGMQSYRFSINWGRVMPSGRGPVNEKGLGFYERLVDTLLENGIVPNATLFHWDLPAALDDQGGWLNRDIADWFADYAQLMFTKLDDRVKLWATLNEPWVVTDGGYLHGALAPGHRNLFEAPIASHNLLRAHGAAVQAYRAVGKHEIGIVVNLEPKYAASQKPEDLAAVVRTEAYFNRQYLDPVFFGKYPDEMAEIFSEAWPSWPQADFDLISQPIDFVGINYYTRGVFEHSDAAWPVKAAYVRQPGATYTETGWEVFPQGLTEILVWVKQRYGNIPQYVTENGSAFYDAPKAHNGMVIDPLRVSYLNQHLHALHGAIAQGVNLRGYYAWSFMDNLEWSLGFSKRFGLVHIDYETLQRTPKESGKYYARVIASNGGLLNEPMPFYG